jgi:hypothetical protein
MTPLMSLTENVQRALEFLKTNTPPSFSVEKFNLPFVVGSGNAYNTGLILFSKRSALFADESNFKQLINAFDKAISAKLVTDAVVISASGEKDSVWELTLAREKGLKTTLLTTKPHSSAAKVADTTLSFQSIDEPYTYNVSTYLGMILSATKEKIEDIQSFIQALSFPSNFSEYDAYSFVLPDMYATICPMLDIKKSELFGSNLSLRAFSEGHARHAKFVVRSKKELVISIGATNSFYGFPENRWHIDFPNTLSFGGMMAGTYAIVGKIQESKHPYYMENIEKYCNDYGPKAYGKTEPFEVIVPGTHE